MKRRELVIDKELIKIANENFVQGHLNDYLLRNHLSKCHKLELDKVNRVYLLDTILKKTKLKLPNSGGLGLNLLKPPQVEKDFEKYFFQIETKPNQAVFEFTLTNEYDLVKLSNSFKIDDNSISRINRYGNSSHCIYDDFPDLRMFCFCK